MNLGRNLQVAEGDVGLVLQRLLHPRGEGRADGVHHPDLELLGGSQVYVDITNLFDQAPAFYNGSSGYDSFTGDPTGRVITVGLRFKM